MGYIYGVGWISPYNWSILTHARAWRRRIGERDVDFDPFFGSFHPILTPILSRCYTILRAPTTSTCALHMCLMDSQSHVAHHHVHHSVCTLLRMVLAPVSEVDEMCCYGISPLTYCTFCHSVLTQNPGDSAHTQNDPLSLCGSLNVV